MLFIDFEGLRHLWIKLCVFPTINGGKPIRAISTVTFRDRHPKQKFHWVVCLRKFETEPTFSRHN